MENKLSETNDILEIPYDIFAITSFFSTGLYIFFYSILIEKTSFPLTSFSERIIGIAVLEGVDAAARTHFYLYSIIITGIFTVILLISLELGMNRFFPKNKYKTERDNLALISILGTSNIIFYIFTKNSVFLFNIYLIFSIFCCFVTYILIKKYFDLKDRSIFETFKDSTFIISLFLLPVPVLFFIQVIKGNEFVFTLIDLLLYYLIFFILLILYYFVVPLKYPNVLESNFRIIFSKSIFPLYLYPFSIPLTNEFQFTFSHWIVIDPKFISLLFFVVLLIITCVFFLRNIKNENSFYDSKYLLENFSLPVVLACIPLYSNYIATTSLFYITQNIFELGLTSTVIQQLFDFGKLPLINLATPHGFMDIYYPILYSIINGYQSIDCFIWQWITPILIVITGYFFLKEFVEGYVSFLLIIFLPLFSILSFNNFIILFAGIIFIKYWKNPQLTNYCLLIITLLLCFAWRPEAGIASVLGFIFLIVILNYQLLKQSPKQICLNYSKYFLITLGIIGLCLSAYIILCLITQISPISAFQSVLSMYMINDPAGTYADLFNSYNINVALQYAIFPLFGLSIVVLFIWIVITRRSLLTSQFILITFLAIATLFLSQRGVQRHSLIEGFSVYYFPLIACSIPLLWYKSKKLISIIFVILILIGGSFVAQYQFTPIQRDFSSPFFEFTTWDLNESRIQVQPSDLGITEGLTDFLRDSLQKNETYFDLSNYIMPFTLLRTEYMSDTVIAPSAGEWHQNATIKNLNSNLKSIPFVVSGGWQIDTVPNELRAYRIAEYIYQNYRPIGKIDDIYEIWLRNDLKNYEISPLNKTLFNYDDIKLHNIMYSNTSDSMTLYSGDDDPYVWNFILNGSPSLLANSKNTEFHVIYDSDTEGLLQIFYSVDNNTFSEENSKYVSISAIEDGYFEITIPESINKITNIRLDPPKNSVLKLNEVYLYPTNYSFSSTNFIIRDYNLKKLPYIWGTYDKKDPILNQPVQDRLFEGEKLINSNEIISFTNISDLDKSSGNYLMIKLKSEHEGQINVNYATDNNVGKIKFDVIPSEKVENYLIRISSQWEWYSGEVQEVNLLSSVPITISEIKILKGD
ncbi:hypothetical protein [Methanolacinia paynteri]|uniref:hypothetical protein n=1 Tax=Methanolacinia paynteri TaxID=230356 RepID=UPI0012F6B233|nr:hypothetical protein [Methanolacinia paynteri]